VSLLVTALAHLHVRNLALDVANDNIYFDGCSRLSSAAPKGRLEVTISNAVGQNPEI
jgi:hypothetical protein